MTRIGQLLLERGWIGRRELATALERKEQLGGRLGTCLLEIGAISEELLLRGLGEQLSLPVADSQDLSDIDEATYGLLPADLAIRAEAVPFRKSEGRLDLALLAVHDLAVQDQISFVVGRRLNLHICHEARVYRALEVCYGHPCPHRYQNLLRQLDRSGGEIRPQAAVEIGSPIAAEREPVNDFRPGSIGVESGFARALSIPPPPVKERSIPLSEEERAILGSRAAPVTEPAGESYDALDRPGDVLDQLNQRLLAAEAANDVARALMDSLAPYFVRTILLRVNRDSLEGWTGRGLSLDGSRLTEFHSPFNGASVLREVAGEGEALFVGPLPDLSPHVDLVSLWAGDLDTECVIARISIRDRPVALLYADRGRAGIGGPDAGVVLQAATQTALALERCILRKRVHH